MAFALGVLALVYELLMLSVPFNCFTNLIVPLVFLGVLWKLKVQGVKRLLLVGALGSLVVTAIYADNATRYYLDLPAEIATSDDNVLFDGRVTPLYGAKDTVYNFTVSVRLPSNASVVENMTVVVGDLRFYGGVANNYTMTLLDKNDTLAKYYYVTTAPKPLNLFVFWANVSGTTEWSIAGNQHPSPLSPLPTFGIEGPAQKNYEAIYWIMVPFGLYAGFVNIFPVFGILVLMVWWMRRARQMRVDNYEKSAAERAKKDAELTKKEEAKVPSLSKAMGTDKGEPFVCSECGADVPADAKVCPKCGEKFD